VTREQIEALSGRALDCAVAERVMGVCIGTFTRRNVLAAEPWTFEVVPAYSTTWQGLGLVVTRLTSMVGDDGDHPDIVIETNGVRTMVTIGPVGGHLTTTTADGPPESAAPTAVARAVLMVVGEEAT
jgi:hypothetical protein